MYFVHHFIKQAAYTLNFWLRTNLYRDMLIPVTLTPAWNTHRVSSYTSKLFIQKKYRFTSSVIFMIWLDLNNLALEVLKTKYAKLLFTLTSVL